MAAKTKKSAKKKAAPKKKAAAKKAAPKKAAAKKAAPKKAAANKTAPKKAKSTKKGRKVAGATAASILGIVPAKKAKSKKAVLPTNSIKVKREWKKYYDVLLDLRDRLKHQMGDLKKESAVELDSYSMHMADSGTDNFDRDSALSLLSADQDAVYEIEEALKRIEKDAYGVCELTGKNIPKSRLNEIPWARYTVEAQAKLEKDGAVQRRKLGSLGTIEGAGASKAAVPDVDSEPKKSK